MGDEASARSLLADMQVRLGRDPHEALGLAGAPSANDVRNAFLTLTKTFHPQKFARMAPDIQKLANEVFLSLRAAHDTLSRAPAVAPTRKSGPIPALAPNPRAGSVVGPNPLRAPTTHLPTTPVIRPAAVPPPRQPTPARPAPVVARPSQPPPVVTQPMPPQTRAPAAPVKPAAVVAPGRTSPAQPTQPMRPFANPRPGTPAAVPTPPTRIAQPSPPPGQVKPATPTAAKPALPGTEDRELVPILQLIQLEQLAAARVALETLTARAPSVQRYQALLHYARGREAQLAKRLDEARVELQDALQIDPELALAKTALAELFTRRR